MKRRMLYRRVYFLAGSVFLIILYIITWNTMMDNPQKRSGSDFIGVYTFGRIAQTSGFSHIYDINEQTRIQEGVVNYKVIPQFYTHIPYMAVLAFLVVDENHIASFNRWAILLTLLNALNVYLLAGLLKQHNFTKENLFILYLGTFLFYPTFSGFVNGQDTEFLLLGAVLWALGMFSQKYFLAGIGLSLTTVRPQIAIFLAIPFLFRYRNVFWGFVLGSSILAAFSIALIGMDGAFQFIQSIKFIEGTVWYQPHAFDMPTISGIVRRNVVFTTSNLLPIKTMIWVCYLLGMTTFCIWWFKSKEITDKHIGVLVISSVFFLPYAHYHDLILLLISIFCLIRILNNHNFTDQYLPAVIPLTISLVFVFGFWGIGILKFPFVYLIMFLLGLSLMFPMQFWRNAPPISME
jgi:hypothetical protein